MRVDLRHGDCVELMRAMPECSVDSIVTDPPYDLTSGKKGGTGEASVDLTSPYGRARITAGGGFMGKEWDATGIAFTVEMWVEALRVLKPGGHLLAFGGTRTYHRMACAIEDAGFEIRDSIHWVYGSGFPKSLNVGKAIDKRRDDRDDVLRVTGEIARLRDAAGLTNRDLDGLFGFAGMAGHWTSTKSQPTVPTPEQWTVLRERLKPPQWLDDEVWRLNGRKGTPGEAWGQREVVGYHDAPAKSIYTQAEVTLPTDVPLTVSATEEARRWEGWGTALKPAHEPIVVARKPLQGTVAGNVLTWGTGGLNIDGCRVGTDDTRSKTGSSALGIMNDDGWKPKDVIGGSASGRWPANIVLDGAAAAALDQQSGVSKSPPVGSVAVKTARIGQASKGDEQARISPNGHGDSGGASRFFTQADFGPDDWPFVYQAKPSKRERNAGLDGLPKRRGGSETFDPKQRDGVGEDRMPVRANHHPTVKPVALMRHLVRLVTPAGGTVLDPFAGSGTTLVAAVLEGFDAIGCEMTDEYLPIIEGRVAWAEQQVDTEQPTLL